MAAQKDEKPAQSTLNKDPEPQAVVVRREPERDLVTWEAPSRPFKRRNKQFFVTVFAMAGIVALVLFLAEGAMPAVLIISLVFLYYVLSTVEPDKAEYKVTTRGVKVSGKLTEWQYLNKFWFSKRFDSDLLIMDTRLIPGRIELVINPEDKDRIKKEVSSYIPFEEGSPSGLDKLTDWASKILPGNK